jgi:hypothetical protein
MVIKVHVLNGKDKVVKVMLYLRGAVLKVPFMMVINQYDGPGYLLAAFPLFIDHGAAD